jgi:hypothetical protein
MEIITIRTTGEIDRRETDTLPTLTEMQQAVGGYIELIPRFERYEGLNCAVFGDEEGKLKGKPVNEQATKKWAQNFPGPINDVLVGDIFVIVGTEEELENL